MCTAAMYAHFHRTHARRRTLHLCISTSTLGVSLSPYIMRQLACLAAHMRSGLESEAVGPALARRLAAMQRPQVPLFASGKHHNIAIPCPALLHLQPGHICFLCACRGVMQGATCCHLHGPCTATRWHVFPRVTNG